MTPRPARHVITASNRAAAGVYPDRGGPLIVAWLRERGYDVPEPTVAPDGAPVGEAMRAAVADGVDVVVTTGGTGISPTDATPEVTRELLDYEIPGSPTRSARRARRRCRRPCCRAGWPAWRAGRWSSTCPGRPAGCATGSPCSTACSTTRSTSSAEATTDAVPRSSRAAVGEEPLDVAEHAALVEHAGAGAVVTFAGVVRDHDGGRAVAGLDYSAHPTAAAIVAEVAADVAGRADGRARGRGEPPDRRRSASATSRWPAPWPPTTAGRRSRRAPSWSTRSSERLPVWKHQAFADGTDEWVNSA